MKSVLNKALFTIIPVFCLNACCTNNSGDSKGKDILWYDHPAQSWEQALPLGNGRLGAMVFGDPQTGRIQLNDDSMWPGNPDWKNPEGTETDLATIRQLLFQGKNSEADQLFVEKFSQKSIVRSHQTLGDLFIEMDHENITEYRRELDLAKAVATTSYRTNGFRIRKRVLVSNPNQAIIIQIESEEGQGMNARVRLTRPPDEGIPTAETFTQDTDQLVMRGMVTQQGGKFGSKPFPIHEGIRFETRVKIMQEGGLIESDKDQLVLKNVKKATIYLVSNSSWYYQDFIDQNEHELVAVLSKTYKEIEKQHIMDHQLLYSRVDLHLFGPDPDSLPTDKRLEFIRDGHTDTGLEELLFKYGRYLLICSSRPGTNPANLQGLWNQHITAPWNADYHMNINLQMNYWLADVTNLSELNAPLFDFVDRMIENGKVTARENFGCSGAFLPHATDIWAPTFLRANTAYWGCSVGAGGWMAQHYWQHFLFTSDTVFLCQRAFPVLEEVVQFYSDWLIEDPRDHTLISAPSTSPENQFLQANGEAAATCLGSAMDQQIIAEVFDTYIAGAGICPADTLLLGKIRKQKALLRPGFVIGSTGRLLEWDREYAELEPGHRHMSHLYGFHPGQAVTKGKTPEIFKAVRKTLDYRLENGGAGTGWSRAWLINCSARLMDGEMAHKHIELLFQKSMFDNLFDAHPPFQIDGNFGYTAGIAEMLVQSHEENTIRLLPALPHAWPSGYVKGLKARGGYTVDIYWEKHKLVKATIQSDHAGEINLIYNEKSNLLSLKQGEIYYFKNKDL